MADEPTANIVSLIDQLDKASEQANWRMVRDLADQILELDPDNHDAQLELRAATHAEVVARRPDVSGATS